MRRTLRPTSRGAGTVGEVPSVPDGVLQVCHPQWRGGRSFAIAFGDPVLEAHDLGALVDRLPDITASGASTIVIQGWPPNAGALAVAASQAGLRVLTNKAERWSWRTPPSTRSTVEAPISGTHPLRPKNAPTPVDESPCPPF